MIPHTKIDAQNILKALWAGMPEAHLGCVIIDFLSEHTDAAHIPFSQFFEIARQIQIDDNAAGLPHLNS